MCVCVPPSFTRYDSVWVSSFFRLFFALLTALLHGVSEVHKMFGVRLVGFDTDVDLCVCVLDS